MELCPHLTSSITAQRTAVFLEPATRGQRGEGVDRARCSLITNFLRVLAEILIWRSCENLRCNAAGRAFVQASCSEILGIRHRTLVDPKPYASLTRGDGHQEYRTVLYLYVTHRNYRHGLRTAT